ncbi:sulfotransferase [Breoghania sp.]|uniref:sulfotransferase family protein n=1 Tax=Breoghania sp. TaxID=2065378 RepID=UPI002AA752DE|nr:sulfotransferase [Breoghania sp.]
MLELADKVRPDFAAAGEGRAHPVAIGGIGGSGTRIFAQYLLELGYNIGSDRNAALDNLVFTLLFKRPEIFAETPSRFNALAQILFDSLTTGAPITIERLAPFTEGLTKERDQHPSDWISERIRRLLHPAVPVAMSGPYTRWGWKEPNSHLVIDRLLNLRRDLVYVHVTRHALDMAYSGNMHQLAMWGSTLLQRDVEIGPRDALSYWCVVQRRMGQFEVRFAPRILVVRYEDMILDTEATCARIADFLAINDWKLAAERLRASIVPPLPSRCIRKIDPSVFLEEDLSFVRALGYDFK